MKLYLQVFDELLDLPVLRWKISIRLLKEKKCKTFTFALHVDYLLLLACITGVYLAERKARDMSAEREARERERKINVV